VKGNGASLTTAALSTGMHSITAVYSGDSNAGGSTSSAVAQNVGKAMTTVALSSSPNPLFVGQTVTFTAIAVGQFAGTPTGTVMFKKATTTLATGTLTAGSVSFSTSSLALGSAPFTAVYGGDNNFLGSMISQNKAGLVLTAKLLLKALIDRGPREFTVPAEDNHTRLICDAHRD
jgi:streptogramin lyase